MKPTTDTLAKVGTVLHGTNWQTALARDLNVSDRTMRRWAGGDTPIPDGVWRDLATLCRSQSSQLHKLATELDCII